MIQIISKEERLEKLEQELQRKIKFYNSGNSTDLDWTKAQIILLIDNIEYEKNPKGVFESSSTRVEEIISSGRINNYEITKDEVIEYEPEMLFIDIQTEIVECEYEINALDEYLEQQRWLKLNKL